MGSHWFIPSEPQPSFFFVSVLNRERFQPRKLNDLSTTRVFSEVNLLTPNCFIVTSFQGQQLYPFEKSMTAAASNVTYLLYMKLEW